MKKLCALVLIWATGAVFAATKGTSTLKLSNSDSGNSVRVTRKALDNLNKEIAALDLKITATRTQALAARSLPASNPSAGASLEALVTSMEIDRNELTTRRESLRTDLQYQSN
jgi:uncharacterized protein YlxW (UPF0749 family)